MNQQTLLQANPPASDADLQSLTAWVPAPLPPEFLAFLRKSDGGQAERESYPTYLRFWPACTVVEYNIGYEIQENVPGLIAFGDDGGPAFIAFDTRSGFPYPILVIPFVPMQFASAEPLAATFGEFLGGLSINSPD